MSISEMVEAIGRADGLALNDLSSRLWAGHAAGHFTDQDAQALAEAIQARRNAAQARGTCAAPIPRTKTQRPPDRCVSMERRRRLATSGVMPPALAARFTMGELATLRIVVDEMVARGGSVLCLDAIAARAGVSRSTAKNAIRQARWLGMVEVRERRRTGAKSLPNVITIVDREWLSWIRRGNRTGGKNLPSTDTRVYRGGEGGAVEPRARAAEIRVSAFMEPDFKCSVSRTRPAQGVRRAHGARD